MNEVTKFLGWGVAVRIGRRPNITLGRGGGSEERTNGRSRCSGKVRIGNTTRWKVWSKAPPPTGGRKISHLKHGGICRAAFPKPWPAPIFIRTQQHLDWAAGFCGH